MLFIIVIFKNYYDTKTGLFIQWVISYDASPESRLLSKQTSYF